MKSLRRNVDFRFVIGRKTVVPQTIVASSRARGNLNSGLTARAVRLIYGFVVVQSYRSAYVQS